MVVNRRLAVRLSASCWQNHDQAFEPPWKQKVLCESPSVAGGSENDVGGGSGAEHWVQFLMSDWRWSGARQGVYSLASQPAAFVL